MKFLWRPLAVLLLFAFAVLACTEEDEADEDGLFERISDFFQGLFQKKVKEDTRTLDQIYQAALKEGGKVIVYSGGDAKGQQNATKQAFEARFPNMTMEIVVDYSIFHGPRVDVQINQSALVPDAIQLQTLQDFPKWKRRGLLLPYKPNGWSKVYKAFRDEDGHYTAFLVAVLSTIVNDQLLPNNQSWPRNASDFLTPEFANGRIVSVHPNFDDAVLFVYKQIVDKYGYEWLVQFAKQNATYVCGGIPVISALASGSAAVGGPGGPVFPTAGLPIQFSFPNNEDPFTTYAMYLGIFKQAKHPEGAKLYLNWQLERNSSINTGSIWSVRTDVPPQNGFRPIWEYPNSSHQKFAAFMANYEERYRFIKQIALFLGEMKCDQSQMVQGLFPNTTQ